MPPGRSQRWQLNREALDGLLRALGSDRDAASLKYELLRRKLIDLFAWERSETPEELADETLNRLAKRLADGVVLDLEAIDRYTFGIARLLMHEERRKRYARDVALADVRRRHAPLAEESETFRSLMHCLDALPTESRELVERYYGEDRARLAQNLGISLNALRNRAMRIRDQLFSCVTRERDK